MVYVNVGRAGQGAVEIRVAMLTLLPLAAVASGRPP
jgi:hypothetical protein